MKKLFLSLLMLLVAAMSAQADSTPEAYAVLSSDGTTLSFYYDDQKDSREGTVYPKENFRTQYHDGWEAASSTITSVVFDNSFANYDGLTSTIHWFYGFSNLSAISGIENLNTSNVTNMYGMFWHCSSLKNLDLSHFDTSNVKNMEYMFWFCSNLTDLNLSNFNTSNVTNMENMFAYCSSLTDLDLSSFNTTKVTDMNRMFDNCSSLTSLDLSNFNTSNVTSIERMFSHCTKLKSINLSNFNTSNVTDMTRVFERCTNLKSLDISHFNTSKVGSMYGMFERCTNLTNLDLSHFDTSKVTNMEYMFYICSNLTNLNVNNFNTSKVTSMHSMFYDCSSLTDLEISNFNTENVTDMYDLFSHCSSLTTLNLRNFNTAKVTNMASMFNRCSNLKTIYVDTDWTTENVTSSNNMFSSCTNLVGGDGTKYDSNYTDKTKAYAGIGGYLTMEGQAGVPEAYAVLSTDKATLSFFYDDQKDSREGTVYTELWNRGWASDSTSISTVVFDSSFEKYDGLISTESWFRYYSNLSTIIGFENLNTTNVTDMSYMFQGCTQLTNLNLYHFSTSNVTDMRFMFNDCYNLAYLDMSHFRTSNVRNMWNMFSGCKNLESLYLNDFNTENVYNMTGMFYGCEKLNFLDLSNFNTENVTSMDSMFIDCPELKILDLSSFNTANVTNTSKMFKNCSSLTSIFIGNDWTTETVSSSDDMFCGCTNLTGGDGTVFDSDFTDKQKAYAGLGGYLSMHGQEIGTVEPYAVLSSDRTNLSFFYDGKKSFREGTVYIDLKGPEWVIVLPDITSVVFDSSFAGYDGLTSTAYWFFNCQNLSAINGIENLNTTNVTDMSGMFLRCSSLTSLDVSNFNTSNVTNMESMFVGCSNLTSLDVSNFNTSNVLSMESMFSCCSKLTDLNLSNFNTENVTDMQSMFSGCKNLTTIHVSRDWTTENVTSSNNMFSSCTNLVGGDGTKYDSNYTDKTKAYAGIGGYLTMEGQDLYTYEQLKGKLDNIGTELDELQTQYNEVNTLYQSAYHYLTEEQKSQIEATLDELKTALDALADRKTTLDSQLEAAPTTDYTTLNTLIEALAADVATLELETEIDNLKRIIIPTIPVPYAVLSSDWKTLSFYYDNKKDTREGTIYPKEEFRILDDEWGQGAATMTTVIFDGSFADYDGLTSTANWFRQCEKLSSINGIENLNTTNVTNMSNMFERCYSLTNLDLSHFNTENVTDMSNMFSECTGLTNLNLTSFNTSNVKDMQYMFMDCSNLTTIFVDRDWTTENVTNSGSMFYNCTKLVGGDGTKFDPNYIDDTKAYAGIGGYLTMEGQDLYTYDQLNAKLDNIGTELDKLYNQYNQTETLYQSAESYLTEEQKAQIKETLDELKTALDALADRKTTLDSQLEAALTSEYTALNTLIEALAADVATFGESLPTEIESLTEEIKADLEQNLQDDLATLGSEVADRQTSLSELEDRRAAIDLQIGNGYFLYKPTTAYNALLADLDEELAATATSVQTLVTAYTTLNESYAVGTIEELLAAYQAYEAVVEEMGTTDTVLGNCTTSVEGAESSLLGLEFCFPDESLAYTVAPTGITEEIQLGYKSNRGFVLTSAGMMWFEQKEGADCYLRDAEGNYIVAISGQQTLTAGTKAEATVWTGKNLRNGSYTFLAQSEGAYLGYDGMETNAAIIADPNTAYNWTITESSLDAQQAFMNLLAEEGGNEEETELTEDDPLVIHIPVFVCGECNTQPFVLPHKPYPIWLKGDGREFPLPKPGPGRCPEDFHPIHIPEGGHAIIDDVTFSDAEGGHHIMYVEGVLEITANVTIATDNWEWFIQVAPTGHVIWHSGSEEANHKPRIKNEGRMDMEEGWMGLVQNTGTVNHHGGTIEQAHNHNKYYLTDGNIKDCQNHSEFHHQGGNAQTVHNYEGGTYTMTDGSINNNVITVYDTIFVNCGQFFFRGGWMRGYGSRMLHHKKGASLWIDGGQFDCTHIHDYFIEAHDDFYIRGNHDYTSLVPMLLQPSITIHLLNDWTYRHNFEFIGDGPTPREPLFQGHDFDLSQNLSQYIGWLLPNKRWRWFYDETENTIEPRDEEVYDEYDLLAYLGWLFDYRHDESASTEHHPQELNLSEREIGITGPVELPVGSHVYFHDGRISPEATWEHDRMFFIPEGSSMRLERFESDFSGPKPHPAKRYLPAREPSAEMPEECHLFEVSGNVYFGPDSYFEGYYNPNYQATDEYIPGTTVSMEPSSKVYLSGGVFDNVVFRLNTTTNMYVTTAFTHDILVYVPTACRYKGFRLMAPDENYQFSSSDLNHIKLIGTYDWDVEIDGDGYISLGEYVTPDFTLNEAEDNSSTLSAYNGRKANITLTRTLRAGGWNTFCVPFAIDETTLADTFGDETEVKQLDASELDGTTLTLYFTDATDIEAGKAYLVSVKENVMNPVFEDAVINNTTVNSTTNYVDFIPVINPTVLKGGDKSVLFVVGGNNLSYPSATSSMNGFRAYFKLHEDVSNVRAFNMNFDNEETSIYTLTDDTTGDATYDLQGRRVSKPQKGIYISNSRKVVVK